MRRLILFFLMGCIFRLNGEESKTLIRVGHFPTITHIQAVIGHALSRQKKGWFEERLGPDIKIEWFVYNAGPSAMEGIFSDSIDITYVGPNPAINAFIRSKGEEIRIICGACTGGAALIVQPDGSIKTNQDFKGKKIGTPQFGNTQDVAARSWLKSLGYRITMTGGDVLVVPTENPDQLPLFKSKALDGIWTIEPWVSRLVLEADGKVYLEESEIWLETQGRYVTTHLVSSQKFLSKQPDILKKWIKAQIELTDWIRQNPDEAKKIFNEELKIETHYSLSKPVLDRSWSQVTLTYDPIRASLFKSAEEAYEIGFIKYKPQLEGIYYLTLLNAVLKEKNLPEVK